MRRSSGIADCAIEAVWSEILLRAWPSTHLLAAMLVAPPRSWWPAAAIAALCLFPVASFAAERYPDLNTDRDGFTPSAFLVDQGRTLVETSYVYIQNRDGRPSNSYPELLCRIGATEWLEWRFGVNYEVGSQGSVVTNVEVGEAEDVGTSSYESSILYGLKAALADQDGLLPQTCFIMEGDTPMYGEEFGTLPIATVVAGWELPFGFARHDARPWQLDTALRYSYVQSGESWFSRWAPSVMVRMPVTERFGVHAEWFGTFSDGLVPEARRPFFSPGTHYAVTERFEIGLRVGWGLSPQAANFFSDAGCAWRY